MANVSIKFNGKQFLLSCDDGQEEHLEELLIQLNKKFNELKNDLGNLGENKLLLITAVKVMDEYHETKKKVEQKKNELKDLSNKFRELKSLIYDYRDKKEEEIKLRDIQQLQKRKIEKQEAEKQTIVDATKGVEAEYQKLIKSKEKSAAQIRSELFALRGSAAIPFEKALELSPRRTSINTEWMRLKDLREK